MTSIDNEVMHAAHEAVVNIAVTAICTCDHDRTHGHPACRVVAEAVDWPTAHRDWSHAAARLLRAAHAL